jgi:hypothetical protein
MVKTYEYIILHFKNMFTFVADIQGVVNIFFDVLFFKKTFIRIDITGNIRFTKLNMLLRSFFRNK